MKCLKTVWSGLYTLTHLPHLVSLGKFLKFLRILIVALYFEDRNQISETVYCISSSVVCKVIFCSEFPNIPDNAGKVTRRMRKRRAQAIAKRYAFHTKAIMRKNKSPHLPTNFRNCEIIVFRF